MKRTRRQLLKLLAAGSAATLVAPAAALVETAVAAPRKRTRRGAGTTAAAPPATATNAEVEKQKRDLGKALKVLRDYKLADGSEAGFLFHPQRVTRRSER